MEAWQQRKFTVTIARREIIFSRDRVEMCMRQLDQHEETVQDEAMKQRYGRRIFLKRLGPGREWRLLMRPPAGPQQGLF